MIKSDYLWREIINSGRLNNKGAVYPMAFILKCMLFVNRIFADINKVQHKRFNK